MKYTTVFTLAFVTVLAAATAGAQSLMEANIPFDFQAGNKTLPAGQYTVSHDLAAGVVLLQSIDRKAAAAVLTHAVQNNRVPTEGKLVFNRYGETHFLAQVWRPGYDQGRQIMQSKQERERARLASSASPSEIAAVPLTRK